MSEWQTNDQRNYYRSQIKFIEKQEEILKEQKKLNENMASATIVLAIAAFLSIIFTITDKEFSFKSLVEVGPILGTFFIIIIITLIVSMAAFIFKIFFKESKRTRSLRVAN